MIREVYLTVSGIIFGLVSVLHLARAINGWPMVLDTWTVPFGLSWIIAIITGIMCVCAFKQITALDKNRDSYYKDGGSYL